MRTEMGKKAFRFSAPDAWNNLQSELHLHHIVSLNEFKALVITLVSEHSLFKCFLFFYKDVFM